MMDLMGGSEKENMKKDKDEDFWFLFCNGFSYRNAINTVCDVYGLECKEENNERSK